MMEVGIVMAGLAVLAFLLGALPLERLSVPRGVAVALQVFKGAVPTLLATRWFMEVWAPMAGFNSSHVPEAFAWWVLLLAVVGDTAFPWFRLRRGMGVLTGLGGLTVLSPWAALGGVCGAALGYVSVRPAHRDVVAVLGGVFSAAGMQLILYRTGPEIWVGGVMVLIFLFRYETLIDGLLEEPVAQ